jgi:hypothetical protein
VSYRWSSAVLYCFVVILCSSLVSCCWLVTEMCDITFGFCILGNAWIEVWVYSRFNWLLHVSELWVSSGSKSRYDSRTVGRPVGQSVSQSVSQSVRPSVSVSNPIWGQTLGVLLCWYFYMLHEWECCCLVQSSWYNLSNAELLVSMLVSFMSYLTTVTTETCA